MQATAGFPFLDLLVGAVVDRTSGGITVRARQLARYEQPAAPRGGYVLEARPPATAGRTVRGVDWPDIVVSLVSGLTGTVLGLAGATNLHRDDESRLDTGARRVTYHELAENTSYLSVAIRTAVSMPVLTSTWPDTRGRLATALAPDEFTTVASAYAKLTATGLASSHFPPGMPQGPESVKATAEVLARVEEAAAVLERRGWPSEREHAKLIAGLKENLPKAP
jgi:hypothetical protein